VVLFEFSVQTLLIQAVIGPTGLLIGFLRSGVMGVGGVSCRRFAGSKQLSTKMGWSPHYFRKQSKLLHKILLA
jgi:hypothetical protein